MVNSIGIVIPSHDRFSTLSKLLSQLDNQKNSGVKFYPIVVADSKEADYIIQIQASFPNAHIIQGNGNWWFTRSVNEGIKAAKTLGVTHVLILNDDLEIEDNYLQKIIAAMNAYPDSIMGSACFDNYNRDILTFSGVKMIKWNRYIHVLYHSRFQKVDLTSFSGIHPTLALNGRGTMIPFSIINQIGYLDEKMVQYTSDYEYCYRATRNNIPVYISWDAKVYDNIFLTDSSMPYIKKSFSVFLRSFVDPFSNNYLPDKFLVIRQNVHWIFWPVAFCFKLGGDVQI